MENFFNNRRNIVFLLTYTLAFSMCVNSNNKKTNAQLAALEGKKYLPVGKEMGLIGTGDSLQCSLFLTRLTDSTLKYSLFILKNWRNHWVETEGVANFDSTFLIKSTGNLYHDLNESYNFHRYSAKEKNGEICIYLGIGEARISIDLDEGKRKVLLENSPLFWTK